MVSRLITNVRTLLILASLARVAGAQHPVANTADVRTIGDIVRASYETITGPAGKPRQWRRDSTLYAPTATFTAADERNGKAQIATMTPEQYRRGNDSAFVARGIYESEIGRHIERFGNVAAVRSISVVRRTPNGPIELRSVNYYNLYWDGTRWWIAGIVWDIERPSAPIPASWIGRVETDKR